MHADYAGTSDYAGTGEWAQLDLQIIQHRDYFGHLSIFLFQNNMASFIIKNVHWTWWSITYEAFSTHV